MPAARRSSAAAPIATSRCPTRSARASTPRSPARADGWVIRDAESRNGTLVNGQKIDEATIVDGNTIRVGSAEFEFHESEEPPTAKGDDPQLMQTIVQDMPIAVQESHEEALAGLPSTEQVKELMLLYQLCIKLLGCGDPNRVVEIALDLLRKRTERVGRRLPLGQRRRRPAAEDWSFRRDAANRVTLNQSLTELVSRQGHAVWVANQASQGRHAGPGPLCRRRLRPARPPQRDGERTTLGAIHVYLEDGRFRQSDFDFIISVANIVAIALVRARALTTLQTDYQRLVEKSPGHDELIGNCPPMRDLKSKINRVARAPGCVLIRGESGSGKELVARAIHRASPRADRPMVSVNCAAIPADLMESQLFGHKAGSFTGADRDHMRLLPAGRPGHAVSRRSRRADARRPGQAAADSGRPSVSARRRDGGSERRRARDRRHQPEPAKVRPRQAVPRRPVLSPQRVRAAPAAAARSRRRHRPC